MWFLRIDYKIVHLAVVGVRLRGLHVACGIALSAWLSLKMRCLDS